MPRGPRLLLAIAIAISAMCIAIVASGAPVLEEIRWTARTSLVLFAFAYAARPAVQLRPSRFTKTLLAERKWIGLGFAFSHAAHLAGILVLASADFGAFLRAQPPTNAIAAATFLLLFAMAFTSIESVKRAMSHRAWKALHRTGMHFAWVAFTATYTTAIGASPIYAIPSILLLGIAGIRVAAWQRRRISTRS